MPLHTDDPNNEGNLSDEEYMRRWQERIDRFGDDGLHVISDEYLEVANGTDR